VVLDRILAQERRLQFSLVQEGIPLTGSKPGSRPPKSKRKKPDRAPSKARKSFHRKGKRR
jgi:ribonuclease R